MAEHEHNQLVRMRVAPIHHGMSSSSPSSNELSLWTSGFNPEIGPLSFTLGTSAFNAEIGPSSFTPVAGLHGECPTKIDSSVPKVLTGAEPL